jgi:hypothetical protein
LRSRGNQYPQNLFMVVLSRPSRVLRALRVRVFLFFTPR